MKEIMPLENIKLGIALADKEQAIKAAGQVLVENGYVDKNYIDCMLQREEVVSTYIGSQVAIPHGVDGSQQYIKHSGLSFLQVPEGVSFGSDKEAKLLIGIAGKNDEHLEMLAKIAGLLGEEENIEKLVNAQSKEEIAALFEGVV
ncbi:PTS sugar transporter subunit IIA [Candidatus Enterococcus ferrettii]|uniref:Mannitol-specific phosphotransferase enzyme IIA component n=1 Tax=Candidatus Enterococcus ferrettii TaxID=2815324 RepID=A0ABV0EVQ0_9ENTE|nr:PTS sugar transporter subunit IIA [Enterococcus sp. 665A]MBO1342337.1 PTS sugar transporter subunit IIA [Enterococcus sp. 665A]